MRRHFNALSALNRFFLGILYFNSDVFSLVKLNIRREHLVFCKNNLDRYFILFILFLKRNNLSPPKIHFSLRFFFNLFFFCLNWIYTGNTFFFCKSKPLLIFYHKIFLIEHTKLFPLKVTLFSADLQLFRTDKKA